MQKKKILYVLHNLSRGGSEKVVYFIIRGLPAHFEPHLVYFCDDNLSMKDDFESIGVAIHHFDNQRLTHRFGEFKRFIQSINPTIVHTHLAPGYFSLFPFLKLLGIKKVFNTYHLVNFDDIPTEKFVQFFIDRYIQVSHESSIRHSKKYHILKSKQTVIYNGIDIDFVEKEAAKTENLSWPEGIHVLGIANFHPQKGYRTAVQALHILIKKYPNLYYHICGSATYCQTEWAWVKNFIAENALEDRIILHGDIQNVYPYCGKADIFFSATEKELLPVSLLEAMAAGLPVVYTAVGGVPEVLGTSNEYGILTQPLSPEESADALERLILDPSLRQEYAQKARERIEDFSLENTFSAYYKLYDE